MSRHWMACFSWSPSSLPGGMIGAREQPHEGRTMRNRRRPGTSGDARLEVDQMFCGWDWGSTLHGVCLLDGDGARIKTWLIKHTEADISALFAELALLGAPATMPVAIERGEGLVVGLIAAAGHHVLMVEPAAGSEQHPLARTRSRRRCSKQSFDPRSLRSVFSTSRSPASNAKPRTPWPPTPRPTCSRRCHAWQPPASPR